MATGETNIEGLTQKTTEPVDTDKLILEDVEDTKSINYGLLADAILDKIKTKEYAGLGTKATNLVGAISELNASQLKKNLEIIDFRGTEAELDAELVRIHKEQPMHSQYKFELRLLDMTEVHSVIPKAVYYVEGWKYSNAGDFHAGVQVFKSYNQNSIYMKRFAGTASTWRTITMV